jgi:ABC-2 type transport system permease protein
MSGFSSLPQGEGSQATAPAPSLVTRHSSPLLGPGFNALFYKECLRFWKVAFQTIVAPVVTTLLYLLIFSHVLEANVKVYDGRVGYTAFLIPGLVMMAVLQNAFANSSSSLIQSKMMRSIIFILLPPITSLEIFCAYVFGSMVRGLCVGLGVWLITFPFVGVAAAVPQQPLWVLAFALGGSAIMGIMGLIAGIWSEKFDHLAVFQNFIIMPLTFLSGVFYSIHSLPAFWQTISHFNPFFYMIDGFRHGFFGVSDVSPWVSLGVVATFVALLAGVAMKMLASGYKLRQ